MQRHYCRYNTTRLGISLLHAHILPRRVRSKSLKKDSFRGHHVDTWNLLSAFGVLQPLTHDQFSCIRNHILGLLSIAAKSLDQEWVANLSCGEDRRWNNESRTRPEPALQNKFAKVMHGTPLASKLDSLQPCAVSQKATNLARKSLQIANAIDSGR